MTHTPGPWHVSDQWPHASTHTVDIIGGIALVAQATPMGNRKEEKHNARLIAAAPDMLEALKEAYKSLDYAAVALQAPDNSQMRETLANARAAIAKAEGGK